MALDFSQYGEPAMEESSNVLDFSSQAKPVEEEQPSAKGNLKESFKRASGDFIQAVDMIASVPTFFAKIGATGVADVLYSLAGAENPAAKASEFVNKLLGTHAGKYAITPAQTLLSDLGVKSITKGTLSEEVFGKVSGAIEDQVQKTDDPNKQALIRQAADVLMAATGVVGAKALKGKEAESISDALAKIKAETSKEAPVFTTEPADLFPETLKTPYGTKTGEVPAGWTVDENGIPVNRSRTENLQRTELGALQKEFDNAGEASRLGAEAPLGIWEKTKPEGTFIPKQDFTLEERPIVPEKQMGLPFEKVTPEQLRTQTGELFTPEMRGLDFSKHATPAQGIEHIQRIPTDITPVKGEPFQPELPGTNEPLGQTGFGRSQRGSIGFKKTPATLEEQAKSLPKGDWIAAFNQQHPGNEQFADQLYNRFSTQPKTAAQASSGLLSTITNTIDKGLGPISTRLGNIHPELKQHLIDFEFRNAKDTGTRLDRVDSFLEDINTRFNKQDKAAIDSMLLNNNYDSLYKLSPPELKGKVTELQSVLKDTGEQLKKYGVVENLRENYFPRIVTNLDGLYNAMGIEKATELQKLLQKKAGNSGPLSDIEVADITNKFLQNNYRRGAKPGFSKGRVLEEIPPEFEQFYAKPSAALHSYLRSATFQIERAKFFGKDAVIDPETHRINVEQSIGSYVTDLVNKKQITPSQVQDVADILSTRFGVAQRQSNVITQGAKDLIHFQLLGDFGNAAMQFADVFTNAVVEGVRPTIISLLPKALNGAKIKAKDFGLMNRISDEFVSDRMTTKLVNTTFKYSGLSKIDEISKDVVLNSAYLRGQKAARGNLKNQPLFYEYEKRFGPEFPQLVEDLKAGKRTELTDRFVISELASRQPIFKSEYSQAYLESPNLVRGALTLQSFMLKTADFMRTRAYNQIKQGNVAVGVGNLAKISIGLALGNVAMNDIRNYLANKPIDELNAKNIAAALFNTFRFSEYFSDDIKKGAFGEAAAQLVAPPYKAFDPLTKDLTALAFGEKDIYGNVKGFTGKSIKSIPIVGDELYGYSKYGQAEKAKKEKEQQHKTLQELMK